MEFTTAEILAFLILFGQLLGIYNSAKTARKNASEPLLKLEARVKNLEDGVMKRDFQINELKRDVDNAHDKIRRNEQSYADVTRVQNKALLAILLWIKDPEHTEMKQIDEAIKDISL